VNEYKMWKLADGEGVNSSH